MIAVPIVADDKKKYDFSAEHIHEKLDSTLRKPRRWRKLIAEKHDLPDKMGRPTKLTAAVQKEILGAMMLGQTMEHAAQAAGIHRVTLWRWLTAGSEGKEPYAQFFLEALAAEKKCERSLLKTIVEASRGQKGTFEADGEVHRVPLTWTAAAWILERKYGYVAKQTGPAVTPDAPVEAGVALSDLVASRAAMAANTAEGPAKTIEEQMAEMRGEIERLTRELAAARVEPKGKA